MSRPVVAFGVDENYVEPLLTALVSLVRHGGVDGSNADVRVLHAGLSAGARERIVRVASVLGIPLEVATVPPPDPSFPVTDWVSDAVYLRLSLADAVPDAERVLYLDCDLLVVDDVRDLLTRTLTGPMGAVRATPNPLLRCGGALPGWEDLGLPGDREYFNSGVLVIDTDAWRAEDIGGRCLRFIADHPEHIRLWDQDALNVVLDDRWDRLPLEYNVVVMSPLMPALETRYLGGDVLELDEALALEDHARILHFAGPMKPWNESFPSGDLADRWAQACRELAALEAPG